VKDGAQRIVDERARQIAAEGYTAKHDDEHDGGELAMAAACYAAPGLIYVESRRANSIGFHDPWPWEDLVDARPRPSKGNFVEPEKATLDERIRLLEKAGALCAAEIDRLLRVKAREAAEEEGEENRRCSKCGSKLNAAELIGHETHECLEKATSR